MSNSTSTGISTVFYHYEPSLPAAALFCSLFALTTFLQFYQSIATRAWYLIPLLLGGVCEVIGFIGRILNSHETPNYSLTPYIIQSVLLLVAPALISASVYMILGYIVLAIGAEHHSMIKKKFMTKIFVLGDICSFMVQSTGASLMTKKGPDAANAKKFSKYIIVGGLVIQLLFFGYFMVLTVVFHGRVRKDPTPLSQSGNIPWRKHLYILFLASILIMVRSVFRVVEYLEGESGYLLAHEWALYAFDSTLMFLVTFIFNAEHPTQITARTTGNRAMRHFVMLQRVEQVEKPCHKRSTASSDDAGMQMVQPCEAGYAV